MMTDKDLLTSRDLMRLLSITRQQLSHFIEEKIIIPEKEKLLNKFLLFDRNNLVNKKIITDRRVPINQFHVAEILDRPISCLRRYEKKEILKPIRRVSKVRLYNTTDLQAFLSEHVINFLKNHISVVNLRSILRKKASAVAFYLRKFKIKTVNSNIDRYDYISIEDARKIIPLVGMSDHKLVFKNEKNERLISERRIPINTAISPSTLRDFIERGSIKPEIIKNKLKYFKLDEVLNLEKEVKSNLESFVPLKVLSKGLGISRECMYYAVKRFGKKINFIVFKKNIYLSPESVAYISGYVKNRRLLKTIFKKDLKTKNLGK